MCGTIAIAYLMLPILFGAAHRALPVVAYPRLIAFYGGPMSVRRVITDQAEVVRFIHDLVPEWSPCQPDRTA
jgi:hypothetical protein